MSTDNGEFLEEDGRTLYHIESSEEAEYFNDSSPKKSFGLDLNLAKVDSSYGDDEQPIQEQDILVVFDLPDDSCGEYHVSLS